MFKALYPNAAKLKKVVQALSKLGDELPLYVTSDGVNVKVLSPDKTMLATLVLPSSVFEEFTVEEETTIITTATELRKIIRRAGRNDALLLTVNRDAGELVTTLMDRKTGIEREFGVPLVPKPPEPVPELQLDLPVSFTMLSKDFKDIVGDLKLIGEEALLAYDEGVIMIKSSEHQKEYVCELKEGNPLILLTSTVEKARATYNIEMLIVAASAAETSKHVTLSFDTGKPLKVEYELSGGGKLIYWIVPRA